MNTDWTQTTRLLKAIVIGLGVLILAAVGLIVYVMIDRLDDGGAGPSGYQASAAVNLPPGARVVAMTADGDIVTLLVEDADGRQQVITVDRNSGAVLGILTLESEK